MTPFGLILHGLTCSFADVIGQRARKAPDLCPTAMAWLGLLCFVCMTFSQLFVCAISATPCYYDLRNGRVEITLGRYDSQHSNLH